MVTASRIVQQRAFVRRATSTGAAPRARKAQGIGLPGAARTLKVDTSTYYRWETGQTVPTHDGNLGAFVRWLKRIGVEDDPAMREASMGEREQDAPQVVKA